MQLKVIKRIFGKLKFVLNFIRAKKSTKIPIIKPNSVVTKIKNTIHEKERNISLVSSDVKFVLIIDAVHELLKNKA